MELQYSLYLYLLVVVVIVVILHRYHVHLWSCIAVGLIIGQVLLLISTPPNEVDTSHSSSGQALYMLIQLGTPIVVYLYALVHAVSHRNLSTGLKWRL